MEKDQQFLEFILKNILDDFENCKIERKVDEMGILFEILPPENEIGKVLGKSGKNIKALRAILGLYGVKNDQKIFVKILNSEN